MIARQKGDFKEKAENVFADLNIYSHMAHFVGKTLHIRPNDILDTWCVPELIVAYGEYANELADRNFNEWKAGARKTPSPPRYIVRFLGVRDLEVEDG